jgi:hypothetical protein
MKTLQINLQTLLFLSDTMSVLAAYNENSKILVYNKPLIGGEPIFHIWVQDMVTQIEESGKVVESTYQTDSFGVNFYDPNSGGTSCFHEVNGKPLVRKFQEGVSVEVAECYLDDEASPDNASATATVVQEPQDIAQLVGIQYDDFSLDYVPQDVLTPIEK